MILIDVIVMARLESYAEINLLLREKFYTNIALS